MIKLIIFDFDGTLGDTRANIVQTMRQTLSHLGYSVPDEDTIAATIEAHRASGKILSMTAYQPGGRLGVLDVNEHGILTSFVKRGHSSQSAIKKDL